MNDDFDTAGLGCTRYPFVEGANRESLGTEFTSIDSAIAIAERCAAAVVVITAIRRARDLAAAGSTLGSTPTNTSLGQRAQRFDCQHCRGVAGHDDHPRGLLGKPTHDLQASRGHIRRRPIVIARMRHIADVDHRRVGQSLAQHAGSTNRPHPSRTHRCVTLATPLQVRPIPACRSRVTQSIRVSG